MNIIKQVKSMPIECLQTSSFSTTAALQKVVARKFVNRSYRYLNKKPQILTYEMFRRPHHIGADKSWMTWNTTNLSDYKHNIANNAVVIAQDEIIRRFVRAILYNHLPLTMGGTELVIKRRGNIVYVGGFLVPKDFTYIDQLYWMWGFTEEILSNLLKQPVKLELQFVRKVEDLAHSYWEPATTSK